MWKRHGDLFVRGLDRPTPWAGWAAGLRAEVGVQNGGARSVGNGADGRGGAHVVGRHDGRNISSRLFVGFLNVQDDVREGCHGGGGGLVLVKGSSHAQSRGEHAPLVAYMSYSQSADFSRPPLHSTKWR